MNVLKSTPGRCSADRVAFLSHGTILEEGPAHDVLTNPRNPLTARFLNVMEPGKAAEVVR